MCKTSLAYECENLEIRVNTQWSMNIFAVSIGFIIDLHISCKFVEYSIEGSVYVLWLFAFYDMEYQII